MDRLFTTDELCEFLSCNRVFVYRCRKMGMPYMRIGSKLIRYSYSDVMQWLSDQKMGGKNNKTK